MVVVVDPACDEKTQQRHDTTRCSSWDTKCCCVVRMQCACGVFGWGWLGGRGGGARRAARCLLRTGGQPPLQEPGRCHLVFIACVSRRDNAQLAKVAVCQGGVYVTSVCSSTWARQQASCDQPPHHQHARPMQRAPPLCARIIVTPGSTPLTKRHKPEDASLTALPMMLPCLVLPHACGSGVPRTAATAAAARNNRSAVLA